MKQLIEDYQGRLDTINQMIENFKSNGSINDIRKDERLKTKAAQFRTIITELERAQKDNKEKILDTLVEFSPEADAVKAQKYIQENF